MNGYPFPQRPFANGGNIMLDMSAEAMSNFETDEGQSLDDIVSASEKDRRRMSMPAYRAGNQQTMNFGDASSPDSRRFSTINFGDANNSLDDFNFEMPTSAELDGMMRGATFPQTSSEMQNNRTPARDLAINTQFSNTNSPFSTVPQAGSTYASPMHTNMDMNPYPSMSLSMDLNDSLGIMPSDMNLFSNNNQFSNSLMESSNNMSLQRPDPYRSESSSATPDGRPNMPTRTSSSQDQSSRPVSHVKSEGSSSSSLDPSKMSQISLKNQEPVALPTVHAVNPDAFDRASFPWRPPPNFPTSMKPKVHKSQQYKHAYSSTGFDMLGVLMRVATRANPQIDIGSVDMSCAFVVCDNDLDDIPIVYCSENFERLTGYSKHMILGRNCRFLQSPDGKVEPGIKRRYVDDESIYYLKQTIEDKQEAQISLINYRRGGQPFMNLLTMIPIPWEAGGPIKFIVGFQVDLVEHPGSMTNKNPDGSYRVNYQRGMSMPSYVFNEHKSSLDQQQGQTISKDEVANVLANYGSSGDSEITRRIWDKVLLENTDDVVHVLSLKGLFLYLSPSSNRVLEYDPSELVGTALSSVCHPSDIVPVTRELKDMGNGSSVNVVFRIRRKKSGYMWFEGHGSLHTEQGKGRKCIILVGRERPVYTLSETVVRASGGVGDNELWTKLSTSGMFLFVSSNVRSLLDKQPDELVGTSMQTLMRPESRHNFGRILELARTGRKGEVKHELINKRGQVLQAFTTVYPGDAIEGQKPTFLVGQTRLLKYSRNNASQRPSMYTNKERTSKDLQASRGSLPPGMSPHHDSLSGTGTNSPHTNPSDSCFISTEHSAATFAGQNGLRIGHQDQTLASDDNIFDELKTTRSSSWQYELRQMEKRNRYLAEEVQSLLAAKKKRKRRKGAGQQQKDCANCHTRTTPEWRRGPSGNRDLCNSCGLRWAKQQGRMSPRTSSQHSAASDKSKTSASPHHSQTNLSKGIDAQLNTSAVQNNQNNHQQRTSPDAHAAKLARIGDRTSLQALIAIPSKIDEETEPG